MFFGSPTLRASRRSALSVSLAAGLGLCLAATAGTASEPASTASTFGASPGPAIRLASSTAQRSQSKSRGPRPTTPHTVDTCADDDSPGSLRAIIASPNTGNDDTIDLTQLPMGCSTITLDTVTHVPGHITISQANLHLLGPGSGSLTIRSNRYSGVLRHTGTGTLDIEGLTIAQGKYVSDNQPVGGCIYSKGTVSLTNSVVDHCAALGTSMVGARGAGVYTQGDLILDRSSISYSNAYNVEAIDAYGGGAFVSGNLKATYASISNNYVSGSGGGACVAGSMTSISSSTISSNRANAMGGLYLGDVNGSAEVVDSTISGNEAMIAHVGALYARGDLKLTNSTVAFNHDHTASYAEVSVGGAHLVLESSILAGNGNAAGPADLWTKATTTITAANNLVVAASGASLPANTIHDCPQLDPLADNGGFTLTHAIKPTSPAIDTGSNPIPLAFDQTGYVRKEGVETDIGAFEWRTGTGQERVFVGGFDGLCDQ